MSQLKTIILFLFIYYCFSCKSIGISSNASNEKIIPRFVQINELVSNKSKYHGEWIETEGYYSFGFERSELSYDSTFKLIDGSITSRIHNALWIEFSPQFKNHSKISKNANTAYVRVQGFLDTTQRGHMGIYSAELTNTYSMIRIK